MGDSQDLTSLFLSLSVKCQVYKIRWLGFGAKEQKME